MRASRRSATPHLRPGQVQKPRGGHWKASRALCATALAQKAF
nr:MAG TPA_asm: hypothetical protein [Caudoviricetes sp.]